MSSKGFCWLGMRHSSLSSGRRQLVCQRVLTAPPSERHLQVSGAFCLVLSLAAYAVACFLTEANLLLWPH